MLQSILISQIIRDAWLACVMFLMGNVASNFGTSNITATYSHI